METIIVVDRRQRRLESQRAVGRHVVVLLAAFKGHRGSMRVRLQVGQWIDAVIQVARVRIRLARCDQLAGIQGAASRPAAASGYLSRSFSRASASRLQMRMPDSSIPPVSPLGGMVATPAHTALRAM